MNFTHKSPKWDNVGAEPTEELIKKGFVAGYKPPASYFNWFWNRISNCIKEIQDKLGTVEEHANNYTHPITHDANMITQDETHRFVSDSKIEEWNDKVSSSEKGEAYGIATLDENGKVLSSQLSMVKSKQIEATLIGSSWTGETAPYSYVLGMEEATETNLIEIVPPSNLTMEQYEAMAEASLVGGNQTIGNITLLAYGEKPTIDIPIVILVRGIR